MVKNRHPDVDFSTIEPPPQGGRGYIMTVAIIDYGSGNLRSVTKAFECVAGDIEVRITRSPEEVFQASHIVLPGVGAFADCMNGLKALPGMIDALREQVLQRKKPFFGIC